MTALALWGLREKAIKACFWGSPPTPTLLPAEADNSGGAFVSSLCWMTCNEGNWHRQFLPQPITERVRPRSSNLNISSPGQIAELLCLLFLTKDCRNILFVYTYMAKKWIIWEQRQNDHLLSGRTPFWRTLWSFDPGYWSFLTGLLGALETYPLQRSRATEKHLAKMAQVCLSSLE